MSNNKQYIIVDIFKKLFVNDVNGNTKIFETFDDAQLYCGIYEFENAWICELIYNYKEDEQQ